MTTAEKIEKIQAKMNRYHTKLDNLFRELVALQEVEAKENILKWLEKSEARESKRGKQWQTP